MTYPIFNSFVNQIQRELEAKNLNITEFKTWHEDRINATGLEIVIDVQKVDNFVKEIAINFDWDRFRETALAAKLEGLTEHPMLQENNLKSVSVTPKIDVEVNWIFDESDPKIARVDSSENHKFEHASNWMKQISKQVNDLYDDDIITRWHLELEGMGVEKQLSVISLISYFQYSFDNLKTLSAVHQFIHKQVKDLLVKTSQVQNISEQTVQNAA